MLEFTVVCTSTATSKNSGSGFLARVRVRVVGFIPLLVAVSVVRLVTVSRQNESFIHGGSF